MIRTAIVEDEPACAKQIQSYLARYCAETGVTIETTVFNDGMDIAEDYHPIWDIIFLDVEMPLLDGISAAERIRQLDAAVLIIFITNMGQYAIRGYEVNALDYVLKPVNYASFALKLKKAVSILEERESAAILLSVDDGLKKIPVNRIYYVEVQGHYIRYYTEQGEFTRKGTLKEAEQQLKKFHFVRCNSCYLVNLLYVTGVQKNEVVIKDQKLPISRPRRKEFLQQLADYIGGIGR